MKSGPVNQRQTPPVVLVISGNDPSGGAGQGADVQAITAMSCHPAPVFTSLTVQDTRNAIEVLPIPCDFVIRQASAIIEDLPVAAVKIGADYLAFGSFYHSRTKPSAPLANIGLLQQARVLDLPLVAIGGVDASNGAELIGAGADMLAVISAVFDAEDSFQAASNLSRLFERNSAVAG